MKWIEYDYVCNADKDITLHKKVEYNDVNLAIAEAEACNGEYTITEDSEAVEVKPLAVELGGTGANTIKGAREKLGVEAAIPEISMNEPTAANNIAAGYAIGKMWIRPSYELKNNDYNMDASVFTCVACSISKDGHVFTVAGNGDDKVISATTDVSSDNGWLYAIVTPDASASSARMMIGDVVKDLDIGVANIVCVQYSGVAMLFEATYSTANVASTGTIFVENLTVLDKEAVASCEDFTCDITTDEILKYCTAETPFSSITIPTKLWQHAHDGKWELIYGLPESLRTIYKCDTSADLETALLFASIPSHHYGFDVTVKLTTGYPVPYAVLNGLEDREGNVAVTDANGRARFTVASSKTPTVSHSGYIGVPDFERTLEAQDGVPFTPVVIELEPDETMHLITTSGVPKILPDAPLDICLVSGGQAGAQGYAGRGGGVVNNYDITLKTPNSLRVAIGGGGGYNATKVGYNWSIGEGYSGGDSTVYIDDVVALTVKNSSGAPGATAANASGCNGTDGYVHVFDNDSLPIPGGGGSCRYHNGTNYVYGKPGKDFGSSWGTAGKVPGGGGGDGVGGSEATFPGAGGAGGMYIRVSHERRAAV